LKSILKRSCLTETHFHVLSINWVPIAKEVNCKNDKVCEVEPYIINLSSLNINAEEMSPLKIFTEEWNFKEPRENELTFGDFFAWITFIIRSWEFHWVI
jgi:hypothetical protein